MVDRAGNPLTLMVVHAHPDDECLGTGGTLAKYSAEGVRTVLVTATLGEEGEIHDPDLDEATARPVLAEIRRRELAHATAILGIGAQELLGYRDSGMAGTPANDRPENFHHADLDEACCRLVALIRKHRPQVVVTYNEDGGYGHPDHVQCHRITTLAFDAAGDPARCPGVGEPWQPRKLYAIAWSRERWNELRRQMSERGIPFFFGSPPSEGEEQSNDVAAPPAAVAADAAPPSATNSANEEEEWGEPETSITAFIDTAPYWRLPREALAAHRTQFAPDSGFLTLPEDLAEYVRAMESFILLRSDIDSARPERDLFAGIRG